ncbi:MAG: TraX family protein [Peptococcaceae bacterium]
MLTGFQLKVLAVILMILDHLYAYLPDLPLWFTWLGRLAAPIFFFLAVEGFVHTRNRRNYLMRLFTFALIMFSGTKVIVLLFPADIPLKNNIFLSLALAVLMLMFIEETSGVKINSREFVRGITGAWFVSFISIFTEASLLGVYLTCVFYFLRGKKILLSLGYLLLSFLFFLPVLRDQAGLTPVSLEGFRSQWMMVFALPFFLIYNGERGLNNLFAKYMFYFIYPLHLWLLYIARYYLTSG